MSLSNYQEDLRTPGSMPSLANSRKQMRQRPKSRIYALPRPHLKHRFFCRVENFGFFLLLATVDVFAINKLCGNSPLISRFFSPNLWLTRASEEKSGLIRGGIPLSVILANTEHLVKLYFFFLVFASMIEIPRATRLTITRCFSRQPRERTISAGITTEIEPARPVRVNFLILSFFLGILV